MDLQKKIREKKWLLIGVGILAVLAAILVPSFLREHVPVKWYYDRTSDELVISPGLLYTLEGYTLQETGEYGGVYDTEVMLPLSEFSDSEYRFCPIFGDHYGVPFGLQEIVVSSRSALSGRIREERIHITRDTYREDEVYFFESSMGNDRVYIDRYYYYQRKENNS